MPNESKSSPGRGVETSPTAYPVYQGAAPNPTRSASVDPSGEVNVSRPAEALPGTGYQAAADNTPNAPPRQPSEPIPVRESGMQSSPSPDSPQEASDLAALREENASLMRALGEERQQRRQEMEELKLRMELSQRPQPQGYVPLQQVDPKADPSAPVTTEQFNRFMQQVLPQVAGSAQAQAIRASWPLTPADEAAILQEWPALQQHPEPARTQYILRAYRLRSPGQNGANTRTSGDPSAAPSQQTRPQGPTVPVVEHGSPTVPDVRTANPVEAAQKAYARAEALPSRTAQEASEKRKAMRQAWDNLQRVQGLSEDIQKSAGFKQRL